MFKFRTFVGGLAAVGLLAALVVGGAFSTSSRTVRPNAVRVESVSTVPSCIACVDAEDS